MSSSLFRSNVATERGYIHASVLTTPESFAIDVGTLQRRTGPHFSVASARPRRNSPRAVLGVGPRCVAQSVLVAFPPKRDSDGLQGGRGALGRDAALWEV